MITLFRDFLDGLEIMGNYLANLGSDKVLEAVPAFNETVSIPVDYLHGRSVVDYIAEKQAKQEAVVRGAEAQRRSVDAWKKAFETPVKPRKAFD